MPAPPKAEVRGRKARVGLLTLPASGRAGDPPPWPLTKKATVAESRLWAELWSTPQAVAWEQLGWTRVVARYVKVALAAELLLKDAMSEARQLEDRLGLTPKAMRLLLWTIEEDSGEIAPLTVVDGDRWRQLGA